MVLVRSSLALWFLGTIVGTTAFPALFSRQPDEDEARLQHSQQKRDTGPLSPFSIDWKMLDKDVHSLLDEFRAERSSSHVLTSSTLTSSSTRSTTPASSSSSSFSSRSSSSTTHTTASSTHITSSAQTTTPSTHTSTSSTRTPTSSSRTTTSSTHTSTASSHTTTSSTHTTTSQPTFTSQSTSSTLSSTPTTQPTSSSSSSSPTTVSTSHPTSSHSSTLPSSLSTSSSTPSSTSTKSTPPPTSPSPTHTPSPSSSSSKSTLQSSVIQPTPTTSSSASGPAPTNQIPVFAVYTDESALGIPDPTVISGFNHLILAFYLSSGVADQAAAWASLPESKRASLKAGYEANGIKLLVSAMGSTDLVTTLDIDPVKFAQELAAWAIQNGMDGVDADYEDFAAVADGTALQWLVKFTTTLRSALPANMVITHAPVAPWFASNQVYFNLEQQVGHMINWYNVQFYSQGSVYTTCESLLNKSGGSFPGTSIFELIAAGIPKEKLVLGKPAALINVGLSGSLVDANLDVELRRRGDASQLSRRDDTTPTNTNGFMEPAALSECLVSAVAQGWSSGVMAWEYPEANTTWINQVRKSAFP